MTAKKKTKKKTTKKKVSKKATKKKAVKKSIEFDLKSTKKKNKKKSKKKSPTKKKPCRQAKWNDDYLFIMENMFRGGRTVREVCIAFNITEKTFYNWKDKYFSEETLQSIEDWKKDADERVMSALYRNATGKMETVKKDIYDDDGNVIGTEISVIEIKGDVRAQQYWLNNRKRSEWADKPEPTPDPNKGRNSFGFTFDQPAAPLGEDNESGSDSVLPQQLPGETEGSESNFDEDNDASE